MSDIILNRQTYILVGDSEDAFLCPSPNLFPGSDLFPPNIQRLTTIVQGSMSIEEILVESTIAFGQLYATKMELKIYDTEDLSGKFIAVFQTDGDTVNYPVFSGTIDSCKLDRIGTDRTIVAYDSAYRKGYLNVATWWNNFWGNKTSATLKELRESLLLSVGILYEDTILPNDSFVIPKPCTINSIGFGAMLKMVCELSCCFPHLDRDGMMRFHVLSNSNPTNLEGLYDGTKSRFQEYVTDTITGIQFYKTEGDLTRIVGTSVNPYSVENNLLIYKLNNQQLDTLGTEMLRHVPTLPYTPSDVNMVVSDFSINLGDCVSTDYGTFYALKISYSGQQLIDQRIVASGSKKREEVATDISVDTVIMQDQIDTNSNDLIDTVSVMKDIIDNADSLSTELDADYDDVIQSSKDLERTVAESQVSWDIGNRNITYYGYGVPAVPTVKENQYDLSHYPNAIRVTKLPNIDGLSGEDFSKFWYDANNGDLYQPQIKIYDSRTNEYNFRFWKKLETLTKLGEITRQDTTGLDTTQTYLDQSTGYLYKLRNYSGVYRWEDIEHLTKITQALKTTISQTANQIRLEASETYTTKSTTNALRSDLTVEAGRITAEVQRATNAENSLEGLIELTENNILLSVSRNYKSNEVAEDDYNNLQETLQSSIEMTAQNITNTVEATYATQNEVDNNVQNLQSQITQSANAITTKVAKNEIISTINQTAESVTIDASKINLSGYVTVDNVANGTTTIDGSCIKTGTIDASRLNLSDYATVSSLANGTTTINGGCITTGTLSADRVDMSYIISNTYRPVRIYGDSGLYVSSDGSVGTQIWNNSITTDAISPTPTGANLTLTGKGTASMTFSTNNIDMLCNQLYIQPDNYVNINGTLKLSSVDHGAAANSFLRINDAGHVVYTTGASTASSSKRYKKDIKPITNDDLDPHRILDIPVVQFKYNEKSSMPEKDRKKDVIGIIAEDVEKIYPVAALYEEGTLENWQERYIVPPMLSLIQELYDKVERLELRIKELEGGDKNGGME